jgi:hypothetical protein
MSVQTEIVDVTPEQAETWLKRNYSGNRKFRRDQFYKMVAIIKAGGWLFDGSPIRFNDRSDLIDGQHRLTAIYRSGITCRCLVVTGLDHSAYSVIDGGVSRSAGDRFELHGIARTVIPYMFRVYGVPVHQTPDLDTVDRIKRFWVPIVTELQDVAPTSIRGCSSVPTRAAVCIRAAQSNRDVVFSNYRAVTLAGAPWFVALDAIRALGMDASAGATRWIVGLEADEKQVRRASEVCPSDSLRGGRGGMTGNTSVTIISESGLYKLVMRSDKERARLFQNW